MPAPARLSHRKFGFLVAGVLCSITGIGWLATGRVVRGTAAASLCFALVALAAPGLLWPLNRLWSDVVARAIRWFNNRAIFGLVYFGFVTPWALVTRLLGRDSLRLRLDPSRKSYFEPVQRQTTADTLREIF